MNAYYHCPDCAGEGEVQVGIDARHPDAWVTCPRCEGIGHVPASDIRLSDTDPLRPWTPSRRRWQGYHGNRLLPDHDPLEWLRKCRRDIPDRRSWHGVDADYHYQRAKQRAIGKLSHTYAGLMQADMLARATMCGTAMEVARQAWRDKA